MVDGNDAYVDVNVVDETAGIGARRLARYSFSNTLFVLLGKTYPGIACNSPFIDDTNGADEIFGMTILGMDDMAERDLAGAATSFGGGGKRDCVAVIEMFSGSLIGNMLDDDKSMSDTDFEGSVLFFRA